jgi:DNA-directed RNA polymerase specialized sigma24 family protein
MDPVADPSFADLIARLHRGEEQAVQELLDRYTGCIRREVRFAILDQRLRRVTTESDICQSVLMRFLAGLWAGRYEFQNTADLEALLRTMVRARIADLARYWRSQRRDVRRNAAVGSELEKLTGKAIDTPSQIVAQQELVEEFRRRLSPRDLQILQWRQDDVSWAEIAERVGDDATAEAVRKQHERALSRVVEELDLGR